MNIIKIFGDGSLALFLKQYVFIQVNFGSFQQLTLIFKLAELDIDLYIVSLYVSYLDKGINC